MERRRELGVVGLLVLLATLAGASFADAAPKPAAAPPRVLAIKFDTDVNPVTQDYLSHKLHDAASQHYAAAVILLDTPGGLESSMRTIVQDELVSPVPVIVYVSPNGARAASAGVWISEAADLLVMAPEANIGSSTPISGTGANIASDLRRKVVNDAAASLRALAHSHGRNERWANKAVHRASNLTSDEALRMHVIDRIAPSLPALLRQTDGCRTKGPGRAFTLHLAGARIDHVSPGFLTRFLDVLIDPNLIAILFLAGIAGIVFEVLHPGVVLPGALGAVSLILSLFGFAILPPTAAGVVLVLLGGVLLVIDLHVVSHGAFTVAGLICLAVGLALLFANAPPAYHVNTWLIVGIGSAIAAFWAFIAGKAFQARRRPVAVDPHGIVGAVGEVREGGYVYVNGELWRARTADGSPLKLGERVSVEDVDGLTLTVGSP
jgi:membrane-bound serine protease (ClpP class)